MTNDGATAAPSEGEPGGGNRGDLTIMEHLLELRNRFLVAAFAVVLGVLAVLFFTWDPPESLPNTFDILLRPARDRIDVSFEMVRDVTALKVHENPEATAHAILPEHTFRDDIGVENEGELLDILREVLRRAAAGFRPVAIDSDDLEDIVTVRDAVNYLGRKSEEEFRLASFSPTDRIGAIFRIGIYGGVLLAMPVLIYEALAFIVPGLTRGERRVLLGGVLGSLFFLVGGMAFAYYIVLDRALNFLLDVASDNVENVIGINEYIGFVTRIILWVGIAYQLPMAMALAARVGLVTARQLLRFWRYAIVVVFVLAAIATPTPDPITQSVVAVPLLGLYFVGVLFARLLYKPREEAPA